jgi:hypothetical protein
MGMTFSDVQAKISNL